MYYVQSTYIKYQNGRKYTNKWMKWNNNKKNMIKDFFLTKTYNFIWEKMELCEASKIIKLLKDINIIMFENLKLLEQKWNVNSTVVNTKVTWPFFSNSSKMWKSFIIISVCKYFHYLKNFIYTFCTVKFLNEDDKLQFFIYVDNFFFISIVHLCVTMWKIWVNFYCYISWLLNSKNHKFSCYLTFVFHRLNMLTPTWI